MIRKATTAGREIATGAKTRAASSEHARLSKSGRPLKGRCADYEKAEQLWQRTMSGQAYNALTATVNGELDYGVRWQPNEYEPDGFVVWFRPLQLTNGSHTQADCPACGPYLLANRTELARACGQVASLA